MLLTSLGWTEILARGGSARFTTAGFLDAESAALHLFTLKSFSCCISLIGSHHLDETETTRLFGVWVDHDRAILDFSIFLEHAGDVGF